MYCQRCGSQNPDGSTRCFSCGTEMTQAVAGGAVKTSGLAVAALVLGIMALFTCGLTALPALICGIMALVKISSSRGLLKGSGMAITGIALPGLLILLVPLLLAILMPALSRVKSMAQRVVCGVNVQGLATAMTVYSGWYDDKCPTPDKWCDLLMQEADVSEQSLQCPRAPEGTCSYAINANLRSMGEKGDPDLVAIFESRPGWNQVGGPELLTTEYHQGEGCNVAFADGHTEFVPAGQLTTLKWAPDE